ncbi:PucR family transcriptional regulator [Streptomyces anandii]|uniref:PucR family transcriptional regulator n=1 Tax=Streptomyces anandii TaxID=285454 RepID=UPI0036F7A9FC
MAPRKRPPEVPLSAPADRGSLQDGPDAGAPAPATADLERCLQHLADASLGGRRLPAHELEDLRRFAAAAASGGTTLRSVMAEHASSAHRLWARQPLETRNPRAVASAVITAIGDAAVALTEGYETAYRAALRDEEAMRREFVDDLLEGRTVLGRVAARAERAGLRLAGPHSVAVARAESAFEADDDSTHYVEDAMSARFSSQGVLITTKDGLLVCVCPTADPAVTDAFAAAVGKAVDERYQVAVSRCRPGPSGVLRSFREARATLDLAALLGRTSSLVRACDLLVFQVLGRDRAAITDLVETVLGGLQDARGGPETLLETLIAYFASGCLHTTTASRLGVSVRTVTYRLARIRQLTGHDPADPDQRYVLQTATLGARLLDWPARPLQPSE